MNGFIGAAAPLTAQGIEACVGKLSVKPADLWAVLQVETRGCGFFTDRRPTILFERHVFSRRTQGRFDQEAPEVSNPKAGGYAGGMAEYGRLERALKLDEEAALESASWGLGQVMGFHARDLGYGTVQQFVSRMMASEDEHLAALTAFILRNGLDASLRHHDWAAFARVYNGAGYAKNEYDKKLAAAHQRLSTGHPPDVSVREGQLRLVFLGFDPGPVDGALGSKTKAALNRFQGQQKLPTTSGFDAATLEALRQQHALLPRSEAPPSALVVRDVPPPVESRLAPAPAAALALSPSAPPLPALPASAPGPVSPFLPVPSANGAPAVVDASLPAALSEQVRQRLTQSLSQDVQDELARLLVLRTQAARELGPSAVQSIDLGLTALLAEQPNLSFVRGIRRRVATTLADERYPLRPLPILRSRSPAIQVLLGLALLVLVSQGASAFVHTVLTTESTLVFGLPARTLLLVGLCGAMGSVVSILARLGDLEKVQGASRTSMLMLGFFKPVVGLFCALFCFALMKSGLLPLQAPTPDAGVYLHMAVCFLVGFSERLAQDLFSRAEQRFSSGADGERVSAIPAP